MTGIALCVLFTFAALVVGELIDGGHLDWLVELLDALLRPDRETDR